MDSHSPPMFLLKILSVLLTFHPYTLLLDITESFETYYNTWYLLSLHTYTFNFSGNHRRVSEAAVHRPVTGGQWRARYPGPRSPGTPPATSPPGPGPPPVCTPWSPRALSMAPLTRPSPQSEAPAPAGHPPPWRLVMTPRGHRQGRDTPGL